MNLKQFLEYKTHCPNCLNVLASAFCSRSRPISVNGDNLSTIIKLRSLKRGQKTYEAKLDICGSKFSVEFDRIGESFHDKVPLFVLDRFKEFTVNSRCSIFKYCKCNQYIYYSNNFDLDLKSASFEELSVVEENFLALRLNKQTVCNVSSLPDKNQTILHLFKYPMEENKLSPSREIRLPLMEFHNQNKMIERLNKLLLFS